MSNIECILPLSADVRNSWSNISSYLTFWPGRSSVWVQNVACTFLTISQASTLTASYQLPLSSLPLIVCRFNAYFLNNRLMTSSLDILIIRVLALFNNSKYAFWTFWEFEGLSFSKDRKLTVVLYGLFVVESIAKFVFMIIGSLGLDCKCPGALPTYLSIAHSTFSSLPCKTRGWYNSMWRIFISTGFHLCPWLVRLLFVRFGTVDWQCIGLSLLRLAASSCA